MLDDLIDIETDQEKIQQLKHCQVSIQKYPLVVHKPDELRVLQHFKNDIVDKLQARFAQEQSFFVQKAFSQAEDPNLKDPKKSLGDISGSGSGNGQKPAQKMEAAGGSCPTKAKEPPKKKTQVRNILIQTMWKFPSGLLHFCTSESLFICFFDRDARQSGPKNYFVWLILLYGLVKNSLDS